MSGFLWEAVRLFGFYTGLPILRGDEWVGEDTAAEHVKAPFCDGRVNTI